MEQFQNLPNAPPHIPLFKGVGMVYSTFYIKFSSQHHATCSSRVPPNSCPAGRSSTWQDATLVQAFKRKKQEWGSSQHQEPPQDGWFPVNFPTETIWGSQEKETEGFTHPCLMAKLRKWWVAGIEFFPKSCLSRCRHAIALPRRAVHCLRSPVHQSPCVF